MTNTRTALAPSLLTRLQSRREARKQTRQLARELADYDTLSARLELDMIIARHSAAEAEQVVRLLQQQDVARLTRRGH
jgi:hypothetical protein